MLSVRPAPGEARPLAWSCLYFFCLLSSYYLIRPVREALGASGSNDALTWLFMGTLAGTIAGTAIFGMLVARFPRRVFVPVVYHVLAASLVLFYVLLAFLPADARPAAGKFFFIWVSVFNVFAVSVFWGFMADVWRPEQGRRLFAMIGAGGTLGAVAGSAVATSLVAALGAERLLLLSALLLECAVFPVTRLGCFAQDNRAGEEVRGAPAPRSAFAAAVAGMKLVARSPYLAAIAFFVLCYGLTSTLLYFEQARIVREALTDTGARVAWFARVEFWTNTLTLALQVFFGGRIIVGLGVGASLAILPALTGAGFAWLAVTPGLVPLAIVQVGRRVAEFGLVRPARESLFTTLGPEEKYAAKSFIDTFVFRGADALGAWSDRLTTMIGAAGHAVAVVPLSIAWAAAGLWLGRRQRRTTDAPAGPDTTGAGAAVPVPGPRNG